MGRGHTNRLTQLMSKDYRAVCCVGPVHRFIDDGLVISDDIRQGHIGIKPISPVLLR